MLSNLKYATERPQLVQAEPLDSVIPAWSPGIQFDMDVSGGIIIERFANLLNADSQGGSDDFGSRPERRHDLGLRYQPMGISDEKVEHSEGLRSEKKIFPCRAGEIGSACRGRRD